jgi:3'(2'), 5'-bisphosphate nucleotidase
MSFPVPDRSKLTDAIVEVALKAGEIVMEVFRSDFEVRAKADKSPVTVADERAEAFIVERLTALAPEIPVVGEELYAAGQRPDISGGVFWLVDALDGTSEFTKRGQDFTVNIALIENGVPTLGVVHAPALGFTCWGSPAGAFRKIGDGPAERIAAREPGPDGLVAVISKSHASSETEYLKDEKIAGSVNRGSSLKFCLIAAGEADIYPRLGPTSEWDIAAGHALLTAAGGTVTQLDGSALAYGKENILNPYFVARGRAA